jgi:hypothetical protein
MIEINELTALLHNMPQTDVERLFRLADVDGSGRISFDEFVDYLFRPSHGQLHETTLEPLSLLPTEDIDYVRNAASVVEAARSVKLVEFFGSTMDGALNGLLEQCPIISGLSLVSDSSERRDMFNGLPAFEKSKASRIRPAIQPKRNVKTGKVANPQGAAPLFSLVRGYANKELFYGWTDDVRSLTGWFLAEARPLVGQGVSRYMMFNHSPLAETPDLCTTMWKTPEGRHEKRMFCEACDLTISGSRFFESPQDELEDDELWEELSEHSGDDWRAGNWEEEWGDQPGEPDDEDDWDSDTWEGPPKIEVPEVRPAVAPVSITPEVTRALARARSGKRKMKPWEADDSIMCAPGFKVVSKNTDHLAAKRNKTSQRRGGRGKPTVQDAPAVPAVPDVPDVPDWHVYADGGFIDLDFPPSQRSLGADMREEVDGWTRLGQLHEHPCLFRNIVPDQVVHQSFAGNVWFLSACCAAAEYPAWIRSMFGRSTKLSRHGRYRVRLYHPGKKRFVRIVVDDYVPTMGSAPSFAGVTGGGEIWPALVEKAFAKMCGAYAQMQWGFNAHGMHYVCGGGFAASWTRLGPGRWRRSCTGWSGGDEDVIDRQRVESTHAVGDWRDSDELWLMLRMSMERCYPVACGVDKAESQKTGLLSDRSYSIIQAREVPVEDDWILRMLLLRNPYGIGEWTGRWSRSSKVWQDNPIVATLLRQGTGANDGTFWISLVDFIKHFDAVDIVRKSMPVQGSCKQKLVGLKRGMEKNEGLVLNAEGHSMTSI